MDSPIAYIFRPAKVEELECILSIERKLFKDHVEIFTKKTICEWFNYNREMFWVLLKNRDIIGYVVIVPITNYLFHEILKDRFYNLLMFNMDDVMRTFSTEYCHLEVIALSPDFSDRTKGFILLRKVGQLIKELNIKYLTTCPVTDKGFDLCRRMDFKEVQGKHNVFYKRFY